MHTILVLFTIHVNHVWPVNDMMPIRVCGRMVDVRSREIHLLMIEVVRQESIKFVLIFHLIVCRI